MTMNLCLVETTVSTMLSHNLIMRRMPGMSWFYPHFHLAEVCRGGHVTHTPGQLDLTASQGTGITVFLQRDLLHHRPKEPGSLVAE